MKLLQKFTDKQKIVIVICALIALTFVLIDQLSKSFVEAYAVTQGKFFLGIVRISYTRNPGIAFGIFSEMPFMMHVITVFTILLIIGICVLFFTLFRKNTAAQVCLAIIAAGAVGNVIDRIFLGSVRDFVDVSPIGFGVCNIADFCVTFGAVALIFVILFIGSSAIFPIKKKWREEAKAIEAEKNAAKGGKKQ